MRRGIFCGRSFALRRGVVCRTFALTGRFLLGWTFALRWGLVRRILGCPVVVLLGWTLALHIVDFRVSNDPGCYVKKCNLV